VPTDLDGVKRMAHHQLSYTSHSAGSEVLQAGSGAEQGPQVNAISGLTDLI
jgi:hypothetical protein